MKQIICDTNVWYLLKSEPNYKPANEGLILTAANYYPPINPTLYNF